MIEWKKTKAPEKDGQYLVYCTAPSFDAEWVDVARFDNGEWRAFLCIISHKTRVRSWAEINRPEL